MQKLRENIPARFSPLWVTVDRSLAFRSMTFLSGKIMFQEYMDSMRALDQASRVIVRWYAI